MLKIRARPSSNTRITLFSGVLLCLATCWAGATPKAAQEDPAAEEVPEGWRFNLSLHDRRPAEQSTPDAAKRSALDRLWALPVLYSNPEGHFIQSVRLLGVYQGQFATVASRQGDWDGFENRRIRIGTLVDFLEHFEFKGVFKEEGEEKGFERSNLTDLWIAWKPSKDWCLTLGQQKPLWSYEYGMSSSKLVTVERSAFVDQFAPAYSMGAHLAGGIGRFSAGLGAYSGDAEIRFAGDDGFFLTANLGCDVTDPIRYFDETKWRLDYLFNSDSEQIDSRQPYQHAIATSIAGRRGKLAAMLEGLYIVGEEGFGGAGGLVAFAKYEIIPDRLELVGRYTFSRSSGDTLRLRTRYETEVGGLGDERGDEYHAAYLGLNWYIYGHRLKVQLGAEYSRMNDTVGDGGDFDGVTLLCALRTFF